MSDFHEVAIDTHINIQPACLKTCREGLVALCLELSDRATQDTIAEGVTPDSGEIFATCSGGKKTGFLRRSTVCQATLFGRFLDEAGEEINAWSLNPLGMNEAIHDGFDQYLKEE